METAKKGKYLDLALYAFGALGLEVILMMLEGLLYFTYMVFQYYFVFV